MESVFLFYAYLIGAGVAFAALRLLWFAALCTVLFASLLYWRRIFSRYRWQYAAVMVVSAGFAVGDLVYPTEQTKPSEIVYDGKYSGFPCEKGQAVSPDDHRPCRPLTAVATVKRPAPGVARETQKKTAFTSLAVSPPESQPTPDLNARAGAQSSAPPTHSGIFNVDPMDGHGPVKSFMGTECSWNKVNAENKSTAMKTGVLPDHTFMISPTDETCYVWNQQVGQLLAKGAVRGKLVIQNQRIVGYSRPSIGAATSDETSADLSSSDHLSDQAQNVPAQARVSPRERNDLSHLTPAERQSIEAACSNAKYLEGPAAYNRCLAGQLREWEAGPKLPDLSRLTPAERQSIEAACSNDKYLEGPARYDECLVRQLGAWEAGPKLPDLSHLTPAERQSIEAACSNAKYLEGPAAYDRCLVRQLQALDSYYR
jgi:hypothetical protein